jgi:hypothetical protein
VTRFHKDFSLIKKLHEAACNDIAREGLVGV